MSEQRHIVLRVEGMTCEGCARHVMEALKTVPGVEMAQVGSWRTAQATVVASAEVADSALLKALQKSGYRAVLVERRELEPGRAVPSSKDRDYDLMTIGGGSTAYAGGLAAENAHTGAGKPYDLTALPHVTFTDPQVASVGLTEEKAKQQGLRVQTALPSRKTSASCPVAPLDNNATGKQEEACHETHFLLLCDGACDGCLVDVGFISGGSTSRVHSHPHPHENFARSGRCADLRGAQVAVEIHGNQTMMLIYEIDPARVAAAVTPIPLERMVRLFESADRGIDY